MSASQCSAISAPDGSRSVTAGVCDIARMEQAHLHAANTEPTATLPRDEAGGAASDTLDPHRRRRQQSRRSRLVESMARAGHNITGVSRLITELDPKRLEILTEILPAARNFGLLSDPASSEPMGLRAIADTARALGIELQTSARTRAYRVPGRHRIASCQWHRRREHSFLAAIVSFPQIFQIVQVYHQLAEMDYLGGVVGSPQFLLSCSRMRYKSVPTAPIRPMKISGPFASDGGSSVCTSSVTKVALPS
jgi:hypothetical protein